MPYLYLVIAVAFETIGTSALKASDGFTRLWPSLLVVAGYAVSFYFLALVLKVSPPSAGLCSTSASTARRSSASP